MRRFYKKYFWLLFAGILCLIVVDVIQLLVPDIVSGLTSAYDTGTLTSPMIQTAFWEIAAIGLGMFLGRFLWRICILSNAYKTAMDIRGDLFIKSLEMPEGFYRQNKIGGIMSYFTSDVDTIQESVGWGLVMIVDASFLAILTFYKMATTNLWLTLIALVPLAILVLVSYFIDRKMEKIYGERQNAFEKMSDYVEEVFTGLRVIKAFVREAEEALHFRKVNKNEQEKDLKLVKFSASLEMIISILIQGMVGIGLLSGGLFIYERVIRGNPAFDLTRAEMVSFLLYFDTIVWPMIALGNVISLLSRAKTSLKRIQGYLNEPNDVVDAPDAKPAEAIHGAIEYRNFSYAYADAKDKPVLRGVTLTIRAGENIGVIGKVGSGKSTLMEVLTREGNVGKGTLFLDGIDIMSLPIKQVRNAIAYVPQDNFLYSSSIQDNIAFSDEALTPEQAEEAASFADVHDNIKEFVEGYRTLIGERGVTLSGGQKQRISIARAYIKHAPIMILDDSVSAVDMKTEDKILRNIRQKRQGMTTIIVASRASTVAKMDRIIVMKDGEVEAFDTPERLMEISPTYANMVHLQELEDSVNGGER